MMEHINQLLAWQEQLNANPGAEYADIDVARRLIKHGIDAIESASRADRRAREECRDVCRNLGGYGLSREQINRNLLAVNPLGNTPGWQAGVNACIAAIIDTIEDSESDAQKPT